MNSKEKHHRIATVAEEITNVARKTLLAVGALLAQAANYDFLTDWSVGRTLPLTSGLAAY